MTNFYYKLEDGTTITVVKDYCDFDEYYFFDGRVYDPNHNLILCLEEAIDVDNQNIPDSFIKELIDKAFN